MCIRDRVNTSNIASPATFFSAAKTKELLKGEPKEVVALMDSCITRCPQPIKMCIRDSCGTLCYSVVEKIIRNEIKPEKSHCFF